MTRKTPVLPVFIYTSLVAMGSCAFGSYIALYYSGIHLGNAEIGLLTSLGAAVGIVAQPVWGVISDSASRKNHILLICLLFTGASVWLVPLAGRTFWLLMLFTAVFYLFQCAMGPISDTVTLELASQGNFRFSRVSMINSLSYAIMAAIAGRLFESDINRIFPVSSLFTLSALIPLLFYPPVKGHQKGKKKIKPWVILKNRELLLIYAYTFIVEATVGFFYSFNAVFSKQQGISTQLIGIGMMVGSFSQFPFMFFFDRLYKKFGIRKLLIFAGIVSTIRWLLYATVLSPGSVIFLWLLHGGTYIVFYLCLAEYINKNVIPELKASGQIMNSLILYGVSTIFGGVIGGALASIMDIRYVFAINAGICIASAAGFLIASKILGGQKLKEPESNR